MSWGANAAGQLGDGSNQQRSTPVAVVGLDNIRAVAAGGARSLALLTDGTVWEWGVGHNTPVKVTGLPDIVAIAAGERHALALAANHQIYAWGENESGQLGNNSTTAQSKPVLSFVSNAISIAAGRAHSVAIRDDLTVVAWGANNLGQLGDGTKINRPTPTVVPNLKAIEVASSADHTLAISDGIRVLGWGDNHACQLGENPHLPNQPLNCQASPTPLDLGGNVNTSGNAIAASATMSLIRTPANSVEVIGLLNDDDPGVFCSDGLPHMRSALVGGPANVISVVSGPRHSLLLTSDGRVEGLGDNTDGELGAPTPPQHGCFSPEIASLRGVASLAAGGGPPNSNHSLAVVEGTLTTATPTFPSTPVGNNAVATVTLTNSGLAPLAIYNVSTQGDFSSTVCSGFPTTIPPGQTCNLTVTFEPTTGGSRTGTLTIAHDGHGRTTSIALNGTATQPKVNFTPPAIDFGSQKVGTTSQPSTITLRNDGDGDLIINDIQASTAYDIQSDTCPRGPLPLAPNTTCTIQVTFSPPAAKSSVGEVTVSHNGGIVSAMSLRGTGIN